MSSNQVDDTPAAIFYLGTSALVVGRTTLDRAMKPLRLSELDDEKICQQEHKFGPVDKPLKTFCASRVPFVCMVPWDNQYVKFYILFDVIVGHLSFLIGLQSLLTLKDTINLHYSSFALVVNRVTFRLQLLRRSAHLRLPLVWNLTQQRPLRESSGSSKARGSSKGKARAATPNHYYYTTTAGATLLFRDRKPKMFCVWTQ